VALACLFALSPASAASQAQATPIVTLDRIPDPWTFEDLLKVKDVDPADVELLRTLGSEAEAREAMVLAAGLSIPATAQLLPAYLYIDGGPIDYKSGAEMATAFIRRVPNGPAGAIRVAALALKWRKEVYRPDDRFTKPFPASTGTLNLKPPRVSADRLSRVRFEINSEPALIILDILSRPHSAQEIETKLQHPLFPQMYVHRSQSFYGAPITREKWNIALNRVSQDEPIDRLYRFIRPTGFFHLNDVKNHAPAYRSFIESLQKNRGDIQNWVQSKIAEFLPSGVTVDRKVFVSFGRGAEGWGANDITALGLEYQRDGMNTFLMNLLHESFHSAQSATINKFLKPLDKAEQDDLTRFRSAMRYIFLEGTATYVGPVAPLSEQEADAKRARGVELLEQIQAGYRSKDFKAMQSALDEGIGGQGLYWFGAKMSSDIVEAFGRERFIEGLKCGERCFFETHYLALKKLRRRYPLSDAFLEAARRLK